MTSVTPAKHHASMPASRMFTMGSQTLTQKFYKSINSSLASCQEKGAMKGLLEEVTLRLRNEKWGGVRSPTEGREGGSYI